MNSSAIDLTELAARTGTAELELCGVSVDALVGSRVPAPLPTIVIVERGAELNS